MLIYGPLADFPLDPEVVLLFASRSTGLILSEAAGRIEYKVCRKAIGPPRLRKLVPQVLNRGCYG